MRILHFTYNTSGGAGKVAKRFHQLLRKHGFESALVNTEENNSKEGIYSIPALDQAPRKLINQLRYYSFRLFIRLRYPKKYIYHFNYNYNYRGLTSSEIIKALPFKPDIIMLHWISDFILPQHIEDLQKHYNCPVIWRYNDLAPVTGGCHYPSGCINYQVHCGKCPALNSDKTEDWSYDHFEDKKRVLDKLPLTVVNSTHETEKAFKVSPLFANKRQEFIRNSLNRDLFHIATKQEAREQLGLDQQVKIIFWGATYIQEPRKGFDLFVKALSETQQAGLNNVLVVIAGQAPTNFTVPTSFPTRMTGLLSAAELALYYQAADLVVVSSIEDGGPMIIVESMLCGTPVVSFATGLGLELVITGETGYRAEKSNTKDLATGILHVLNLPPAEYQALCDRCYEKAISLYGEEQEINAYKKLFAELTSETTGLR